MVVGLAFGVQRRTGGEEDLGKEGRGEDVLGHRGDGGGGMERRENQNIKREEEEAVGECPGEWEMEPLGSFNLRFLESWRRNCLCEPQKSIGIYTINRP